MSAVYFYAVNVVINFLRCSCEWFRHRSYFLSQARGLLVQSQSWRSSPQM
jgi:hypothetical protein